MAKRLIAKKPFDLSARVTMQLGRESISSSTVAVSELIKNAYDADAENVKIRFFIREAGAVSTLIIEDDGLGMDSTTLINHWLKIGTNNKVIAERSFSKYRILTGAKGLGRLGIDRLCKQMILYTKKKGSSTVTQLSVDWRNYEDTDQSLSNIQHEVYETDIPVTNKYGCIFPSLEHSGTFLVLIGLRDNWNSSFISALENELRLLISPYRSYNDFSITLNIISKELNLEKQIDSEDILQSAHWKVISSVDDKGRVKATFINNVTGTQVEHEPIPWNEWIAGQNKEPLFGPLKFTFYYLPRTKLALSKVNLSATNWRKFMELNRGIRIYRDDFRVRPYGEPSGKGDWLDLGYRKAQSPGGIRQGGFRVGPSQIIGALTISKIRNSILDDQANREGIVENDAFFQMRTFAIKIIETFEELAHRETATSEEQDLSVELDSILKKANSDFYEAFDEFKKISFEKRTTTRKKQKLSNATALYQKIRELERAKISHQKAIDEYYKSLTRERIKLEEEKNTLSNLASIGILTVCFGHEIRTQSALALENSAELIDMISDAEETGESINFDEAVKVSKIIKNSITYVNGFSKLAINNITPDKRTRKKVNVPSVFDYIFSVMSSSIRRMGIDYDIECVKIDSKDFNVRSYEIDWESIAINLITNSMWALNYKMRGERKIKVTFERIGGTKLKLSFEDSGCGLETGQEKSIFMPMKSSKRDRTGNVIGTGMGLAIVNTQVTEHMAGIVYAQKNTSLGGAGFYIEVNQDA